MKNWILDFFTNVSSYEKRIIKYPVGCETCEISKKYKKNINLLWVKICMIKNFKESKTHVCHLLTHSCEKNYACKIQGYENLKLGVQKLRLARIKICITLKFQLDCDSSKSASDIEKLLQNINCNNKFRCASLSHSFCFKIKECTIQSALISVCALFNSRTIHQRI